MPSCIMYLACGSVPPETGNVFPMRRISCQGEAAAADGGDAHGGAGSQACFSRAAKEKIALEGIQWVY